MQVGQTIVPSEISAAVTDVTANVKGNFARSMLTLLGGNIIAQLIPYFATIILARLFKPAAFGYLALFTSIASTFAILATGRYELAVLLPEKECDARALVFAAIIIALLLAIILEGWIYFLPHIPGLNDHFNYFEAALPLAILAIAGYQILTQWVLRQGRYHFISIARFVQATMTVVVACTLGWLGYERGLIMGYLFGWISGTCFLLVCVICMGMLVKLPTRHEIRKNVVRFSDHALFGAIPALLDTAAIFALIFIINQHYGSEYTGQYNLSKQFVYGPISLIVGAVGQVIFRESAHLMMQKKSDQALFKTITKYLTYASLFYVIILMIGAPKMFDLFFGTTWKVSGQITVIVAVGYGIRLLVSTLSGFLLAHNALRVNGIWQGSYFVMIASLYFFNPKNPLIFFTGLTLLDTLMFGIYFGLIRRVVYKKQRISL